MVGWSDGMGRTLHRAFDLVGAGYAQAVDLAVALGFERILTSGGAPSVRDGIARLAAVFATAGPRITIMPGAGVDAQSVGLLRVRLPLREVHASCSEPMEGMLRDVARLGLAGHLPRVTSAAKVRALKLALAG